MGLLGFGFVAKYLPEAAISAYLAAAALHVILSQLTCIFGIMISFHAGPISFFYVSNSYPHPEIQVPLPLPPKGSGPEWRGCCAGGWVNKVLEINFISSRFTVLVSCTCQWDHVLSCVNHFAQSFETNMVYVKIRFLKYCYLS